MHIAMFLVCCMVVDEKSTEKFYLEDDPGNLDLQMEYYIFKWLKWGHLATAIFQVTHTLSKNYDYVWISRTSEFIVYLMYLIPAFYCQWILSKLTVKAYR